MIEVFEGRLGGGKSYSAVVRMVDVWRRGGVVCTNVEVIWPAVVKYVADHFRLQLEDDQLIKLSEKQIGLFHHHTPSGTADLPVLVVIDEAHLVFNARDFSTTDKLYRETLTFLTQSRKVATDVIFISQSALNIDKQFARLVQFVWRFRDLSRWKIPGLGVNYPFQQILCAQFDYDGRTMLNRQFIKKDPCIFALYETNSLLRPFPRLDGVITKRVLKKVERSKKSMAKILIPLGVVVGLVCVFLLFNKVRAIGKPSVLETSSSGDGSSQSQSGRPSAPPVSVRGQPSAPPKTQNAKAEAAYAVYEEEFRGWYGERRALHTSSGWYEVGEMSNKGFVSAVSPDRARILTPEGGNVWVVTSSPAPRVETNEGKGNANDKSAMAGVPVVSEVGGRLDRPPTVGEVGWRNPVQPAQPEVKPRPKTNPAPSGLSGRRLQIMEKSRDSYGR
jgi:hypothetical protein